MIGEFQPKSYTDGGRKGVPSGAPISDYYPAIVDEATFKAAQEAASIAGIDYQNYLLAVKSHRDLSFLYSNIPYLLSEGIFVCPMLVVLICRRVTPAVVAYAAMLFVIMAGRIYYLLPERLTGVDGLSLKQDWSGICLSLLGALSGIVLGVWAIVRVFTLIHIAAERLRGVG